MSDYTQQYGLLDCGCLIATDCVYRHCPHWMDGEGKCCEDCARCAGCDMYGLHRVLNENNHCPDCASPCGDCEQYPCVCSAGEVTVEAAVKAARIAALAGMAALAAWVAAKAAWEAADATVEATKTARAGRGIMNNDELRQLAEASRLHRHEMDACGEFPIDCPSATCPSTVFDTAINPERVIALLDEVAALAGETR